MGSSTDKTKQLEEVNRELMAKNDYLSKTCQDLKAENETVRKQTEEELKNMSKQMTQNNNFADSLKVNNEDLMQRVGMIPEF